MNIHILSNSPTRVNSGFGIVTRNLSLQLQKLGHNVSISDMQNIYNKEYWNSNYSKAVNGITIYPLNSVQGATGNEFYTSELTQLIKNLKDSKAEVLLIIYPAYNDVIASNHLHEVFKPTCWYYPLEGENLPSIYSDELKKVHTVIPMTKQGKTELEKTGLKNIHNVKGINKEIYHGFDPEIFYKLNIKGKDNQCLHYCKWSQERYQYIQDKRTLCKNGCFECGGRNGECKHYEEEEILINILKQEYAGKVSNLANLKDQFGVETIFSFTGDNNGTRKKIDRLLNAYSLLCKKNHESLLLLHTLPVSNSGLNLWEYIKKYELDNFDKSKVVFTYGVDDLGNSWSDKALNIFYNVSDVCVSTSSGEGFNLPLIESMVCEKANIGPDFSSFTELIGNDTDESMNRGMLCDIQGHEKLPSGLKRALVLSKNVAECMEIMHHDKNMRSKFEDNAYNWVQKYTWNDVAKEFDNLMTNLGRDSF